MKLRLLITVLLFAPFAAEAAPCYLTTSVSSFGFILTDLAMSSQSNCGASAGAAAEIDCLSTCSGYNTCTVDYRWGYGDDVNGTFLWFGEGTATCQGNGGPPAY